MLFLLNEYVIIYIGDIMTQKSISRIKGNAYDKIDQALFMRYPRYEDVRTTFLDVRDLTLARCEDKAIVVHATDDVSKILDDIMKEDFSPEDRGYQKVLKR